MTYQPLQSEDATLKTAMESDRLLLEKAAKAAGYAIDRWLDADDATGLMRAFVPDIGWWNPLVEDGDALRLAVKLQLEVTHFGDVVTARPWNYSRGCHEEWTGLVGADPYAATRRAIVRAAASLSDQVGRTQ